jgi:D-3-phosphoglycerate dehydrogenase
MDEGHLILFRYQDVPGMIGRVGTAFGAHGINISQAAVGRQPPGGGSDLAVMAITADAPIPQTVIEEIVASDGFIAGRAVTLASPKFPLMG